MFPPASQGHNWNTVTVNPDNSNLMKCVQDKYAWKLSGNDLTIQSMMNNRDSFDIARSFQQYYSSFKSFIAFGISDPNPSQKWKWFFLYIVGNSLRCYGLWIIS